MDKRGICFANTWQAAWLKNFTAHMGLQRQRLCLLVDNDDDDDMFGRVPLGWLNYQRAAKKDSQIGKFTRRFTIFSRPDLLSLFISRPFVQHANYHKCNCRRLRPPSAPSPLSAQHNSSLHTTIFHPVRSCHHKLSIAANESRALINREFINTARCH